MLNQLEFVLSIFGLRSILLNLLFYSIDSFNCRCHYAMQRVLEAQKSQNSADLSIEQHLVWSVPTIPTLHQQKYYKCLQNYSLSRTTKDSRAATLPLLNGAELHLTNKKETLWRWFCVLLREFKAIHIHSWFLRTNPQKFRGP